MNLACPGNALVDVAKRREIVGACGTCVAIYVIGVDCSM